MVYQSKNLSIYYEKYGTKKKTIVILPGWGNTRESFSYLISYLQNHYTIYILDYPGFGNSSFLTEDWKVEDYASLIKNFLNDLGIYNPIILAHSFGGRIASILLGKYHLFIQKIILMDVAGIKRRKSMKQFLKEKIYKFLIKASILFPKRKEIIRQKLHEHFASPDYYNIPFCMKKTFQNIIQEDLRKYYRNITSEVLIIWGEKDQDTPLKDGKALKKLIKNSALITYPKCGHFAYLENPYLTIKIIEDFCK